MRNVCKHVFYVLTMLLASGTFAQQGQDSTYWQISPRVGYDFPTYHNNTPFIDYKGGLNLGVSVDYYWKWFGFGADFDYIRNRPESTYPTENLSDASGVPITNFDLLEDDITRLFFGIGPNFQHQSRTGRFVSELNLRAGIASIKGGETLLTDLPVVNGLNYHAGYDQNVAFTAKGQLRFTYFLNEFLGVQAGGYYMRHFNVSEEVSPVFGVAAAYQPFTPIPAGGNMLTQGNPMMRQEACQHDISSVGAFVGLTFKLGKKAKKVCNVCGKDHQPHCCATCGCDVTITARDKFSKEVLPHTDVILTDIDGNVLQSGTTNSYGTVVFQDVVESNYIIKGKLYDVALDEGSISLSDFEGCKRDKKSIQKEIVYSDLNFVLKGNVVECNRDVPLEGVDVILKNVSNPGQKNTRSDADGGFIFHVKQASNFLLKGNKNGYFSNEVNLSTSDYDRNQSLFIDFEMCVNPCGEAIRLDNIIFNLDKWDILPAAHSDLDYVVTLMRDNPAIKVEMSSHTDSRGSNAYNETLSQKRAQSTVDYLTNKGISRDRLIARGAGETELLNECADGVSCDEASHTLNRRTEFKVVCP